ncbi:MAG TPA: hypothetical protein PKZ24_11250, partial [Nitrospirales bacterium]|nr:hypothetical protein [Nitrospirales bacterium]
GSRPLMCGRTEVYDFGGPIEHEIDLVYKTQEKASDSYRRSPTSVITTMRGYSLKTCFSTNLVSFKDV